MKLAPFTVSFRSPEPATTLGGSQERITGRCCTMNALNKLAPW